MTNRIRSNWWLVVALCAAAFIIGSPELLAQEPAAAPAEPAQEAGADEAAAAPDVVPGEGAADEAAGSAEAEAEGENKPAEA